MNLNAQNVTVFESKLDVPPAPECLTRDSIVAWINSARVVTKGDAALFGYTVGTVDAAVAEDRDKPRFIFDDQDRYLGLATWSPSLQGWTIGGQVGQLMTLVRTAASVSIDLAARPLAGWKLADGTAPGIPDLTPKPSASPPFPPIYFSGTAPDWAVYTVAYTG